MRKHKIGDHVLVKLSGGRIVEAQVEAVVEKTGSPRLQVSFGNETARQIVEVRWRDRNIVDVGGESVVVETNTWLRSTPNSRENPYYVVGCPPMV
jgi:hypothetical protein